MATSLEYDNLRRANDLLQSEGGYFSYHPSPSAMLSLIEVISTYPARSECITPMDWHCTVMHSKVTGKPWKEIEAPAYACIRRFECWVDHKGRDIIVALLHFPKANAQHRNLSENGWEHGFPDYNAHINLIKGATHREWAAEATKKYGGRILQFKDQLFYSPVGL